MTRRPNALAAFTIVLLRCKDRYLLLKRSSEKRFAPNRWTGIGGRVESSELDDLTAALLREIDEETGIQPNSIHRLSLRRALLQARPDDPLTVLLYFTGELSETEGSDSDEGELSWLRVDQFDHLDVIENTALVLPLLVDDIERDPDGDEPLKTGAAAFNQDGSLERITWSR